MIHNQETGGCLLKKKTWYSNTQNYNQLWDVFLTSILELYQIIWFVGVSQKTNSCHNNKIGSKEIMLLKKQYESWIINWIDDSVFYSIQI